MPDTLRVLGLLINGFESTWEVVNGKCDWVLGSLKVKVLDSWS